MKKILWILFVCGLLTSCANPFEGIRDPDIHFDSLNEIYDYLNAHITYKSDEWEYWQAPQDTIDKGTGDCEDYAIFIAYFADRDLNASVTLCVIETGLTDKHMIVRINGVYHDSTSRYVYRYEPEILEEWSLKAALNRCRWGGSRSAR